MLCSNDPFRVSPSGHKGKATNIPVRAPFPIPWPEDTACPNGHDGVDTVKSSCLDFIAEPSQKFDLPAIREIYTALMAPVAPQGYAAMTEAERILVVAPDQVVEFRLPALRLAIGISLSSGSSL